MPKQRSILVIDNDNSTSRQLSRFFESHQLPVRTASTAAEGLAAFSANPYSIILLEVRLPDRNGLELLSELTSKGADVVVITASGALDIVVQAIQNKACDYLIKPLDLNKVLALAERIWLARFAAGTLEESDSQASDTIVGQSPVMQGVYKLIARATTSSSPVLIQGETGTGKELVARAIHQFSPRRTQPFVAINCGAIPSTLIESELFGHVRGAFTSADSDHAGRFESADRGCLLLDEIADLPLPVQVKLLRVLDSGVVERVGSSRSIRLDVRILAATNKNLAAEVEQGRFRQDLYYRLAVLHITLPPLSKRSGDIPLLAAHYLRQVQARGLPPQSISAQAMTTLTNYSWPGNVREFKNAIEHAAALAPGRTIMVDDLPESIRLGLSAQRPFTGSLEKSIVDFAAAIHSSDQRYNLTIELAERALIADAMSRHDGNQSDAAAYLGVHRNTLRNKLRQLSIDSIE